MRNRVASPLPLAGEYRPPPAAVLKDDAEARLRLCRIVRCDPGGGSSLPTNSLTRGRTPTPALPRKRERERDAVAVK